MKFFLTLNKKSLAVILAAMIITLLASFWLLSLKYGYIDGSTHEKRALFIRDMGYVTDETDITAKEITIPSQFGDVYSNYNELQKEAGFDLYDFRGRKATVYSYKILDSDKILNLIICDGEIIGGDISDPAIDGEMKPLA